MKTIKYLALNLSLLNLLSCASTPETTHYYSLNLNTPNHALTTLDSANKTHIRVGPVQLVKFLQQDGLVMQIGEHELYTASYHRWAEPLEQAIARLLVQELNNISKQDYQYGNLYENQTDNSALQLQLIVDKFNATDTAEVIFSGHYQLYNRDKAIEIKQSFTISEYLTADGYPHSVEKLQRTIVHLAKQINNSISQAEERLNLTDE